MVKENAYSKLVLTFKINKRNKKILMYKYNEKKCENIINEMKFG